MMRDAIFSYNSFVNTYTARRQRDKNNRATDSNRNDSDNATYGRQGKRREEFVVRNPNPGYLN
jgi:hypothetical protein